MLERSAIEKKVNDLLKEQDLLDASTIDMSKLAGKLGFKVIELFPSDNVDGFILVQSDQRIEGQDTTKLIGVNADRDYTMKRFIVAHELGHYFLDYKNEPIFAMRESIHGRSDEENSIDFFAACLLMPEKAFTKEFNKLDNESALYDKAKKLSERFQVSIEGVIRRFDELNLV
jgi:Zn-dependent peptidase ImmA (M78 family)